MQMMTTAIYGVPIVPAALADEKGNAVVVQTVANIHSLEHILRPVSPLSPLLTLTPDCFPPAPQLRPCRPPVVLRLFTLPSLTLLSAFHFFCLPFHGSFCLPFLQPAPSKAQSPPSGLLPPTPSCTPCWPMPAYPPPPALLPSLSPHSKGGALQLSCISHDR